MFYQNFFDFFQCSGILEPLFSEHGIKVHFFCGKRSILKEHLDRIHRSQVSSIAIRHFQLKIGSSFVKLQI